MPYQVSVLHRQHLVCCNCRQTQTQHSGSVFSKMASVSLLDVLHEVTTLADILTPNSQKALSATCKSCRVQFIAQVQVVTIVCKEDYALVLERKWPRLSMVILHSEGACSFASPPPDIMMFNIHVSSRSNPNNRTSICLQRPLHNVATGLPWTRSAAQQLAHQMRRRWPSIRFFMMTHALDGLGLDIVSQLVKGTWTELESLSLSGCELKAEEFLLLSQGNWPGLTYLDVSGNCLDADGMASLANGNWPC